MNKFHEIEQLITQSLKKESGSILQIPLRIVNINALKEQVEHENNFIMQYRILKGPLYLRRNKELYPRMVTTLSVRRYKIQKGYLLNNFIKQNSEKLTVY